MSIEYKVERAGGVQTATELSDDDESRRQGLLQTVIEAAPPAILDVSPFALTDREHPPANEQSR